MSGEMGEPADWAGVYHLSCGGSTTWCGFVRAIFERGADLLGDRQPKVDAIATAEYPTPAKRPVNSVLPNELLESRFGIRLPGWEAALDKVLDVLREEGKAGEQP